MIDDFIEVMNKILDKKKLVYVLVVKTDVIFNIVGVYSTLELANEAKSKCMVNYFSTDALYYNPLHILERILVT